MNESVLMSIHGRHIEKIATGLKVDELRKRIPKLELPYKVYAYETKDKSFEGVFLWAGKDNSYMHHPGKVTLEFIVDRIDEAPTKNISPETIKLAKNACVSVDQLCHYFDGETATGLHITNVKVYSTPKELSEFIRPSNGCCNEGKCNGCKFLDKGIDGIIEDDCLADFDTDSYSILRRAPQSWCYVEEL